MTPEINANRITNGQNFYPYTISYSSYMHIPCNHTNDLVVIASMAGAPNNPNWYYNFITNPDVTIEIGIDKYEATVIETKDIERARLYSAQAEQLPVFHKYAERAAPRVIPVFRIVRKSE